jgi:outer membrane protein OmpA-like peptidoglycan-associated protein
MNRSTVGALLLLVLGGLALGGYKLLEPTLQEKTQRVSSDARTSKGRIVVGTDNFVGYFPLCSPYMSRLMLADGYTFVCEDDKADITKRLTALREGKTQFAVSTVDTYLLSGSRFNFPGTIVSVLDESSGADGIVSHADIKSLDDLRGRLDTRFAFAPETPSDHLRKIIGSHFDIPMFRSQDPKSRIETKDSREAYDKLVSGGAQVAILWEPDLSRAISRGYRKLLGSEQIQGQIVDVLLSGRDFHDKNPELVRLVLANYFKTLKYYRENTGEFTRDAARYTRVDEKVSETMLKGVSWKGLTENAEVWMGAKIPEQIQKFGLIEAINSIAKIQQEFGDTSNLPGGDPKRIINSSVLLALYEQGGQSDKSSGNLRSSFSSLDNSGWEKLRTIGALKTRPVVFGAGVASLDLKDKEQLDASAEAIKAFPNFRIEIQGHTRPGGDEAENAILSQERAEAVMRYLRITHGIDENRIRAIGFGSSKPFQQSSGESYRSYTGRLSRVEIHLKGEVY